MLYNSNVAKNGSSHLRNVWRISTPGENPYMRSKGITNPFVKNAFNKREFRAIFAAAQDQLCTGNSQQE